MGLRAKRAALILAICTALLLAAAAAGLFVLSSERFARWQKERLEKRLADLLGRAVTIGRLEIVPLEGRIRAEGILVRASEDPPDRPLLRIGSVSGRLSLRSVLSGRLVFRELSIVSPALSLRRSDGAWSWPETGGRGTGRIDALSLEVTGGRLRVDDLDTPLELTATGVELEAAGRGRRQLEGRLQADAVELVTEWTGRRSLSVSAAFSTSPGRIAFSHLRLDDGWLSVSGDGEIGLDPPAALRARGSARLDAGELRIGGGEAGRYAGELLFEGELGVREGSWTVEGSLRSEGMRAGDFRIAEIEGPLRGGREEGLLFGPARAMLYGGRAEGTLRWRPGREGGGEAAFEFRGSDLAPVLDALGRPLRVAGLVSGTGSVRWASGAGWPEAGGAVSFEVSPPSRPPAGRWPVAGEGEIELGGGTVGLRVQARARSSQLVARGRFDPATEGWDLEHSFSSDDLAAAAPLLRDLAEDIGLDPSGWRLEGAGGRGVVAGRARREGGEWTAEGTFAFPEFLYSGGDWGETVGRFDLAPGRLRLSEIAAARDGFHLGIDAEFERGGDDGFTVSGHAAPWDVQELLRASGLDLPVEGTVEGDFEFTRARGEIEGSVEATMGPGTVRGLPVERGRLAMRYAGGLVLLSPLELGLAGGRAVLAGSVAVGEGAGRATVRWTGVALDRLGGPDGGPAVRGTSDGSGELASGSGAYRFEGQVSSPSLEIAGRGLGPAKGSLSTDFEQAEVSLAFEQHSCLVEGRVGLAPPRDLEARLRFEGSDLSLLAGMASERAAEIVAGSVDAALTVSGPGDRPGELNVAGTVARMDLLLGPSRFDLASPAEIAWEDGRIRVDHALLEGEGSRVTVSGWISAGDPVTLEATAEGDADLAALQAFLPETSLRGLLHLNLRAAGTLDSPRLTGTITVRDGRLRRLDVPLAIENLSLDAGFAGGRLEIRDLSASLGGGQVRGSAGIVLDGFWPEEVDARLNASAVTVAGPRGFRATYSGELRLTGPLRDPLLSGDLEIIRGIYREDFRLDAIGIGARTREFEPASEVEASVAGALRLDLRLHADDDLRLRNDFGDIECRADLALGGSVARPELSGRIVAFEGGRMNFRRVSYRLREGSVELSEPVRSSFVTLLAETRVGGYEVLLRVYGPLDRLEYDLTSNPSLPPDQIVSLLVTGSPTALASGTGEVPGDLARAYLGGTVTDYLEEPLEKLFRLDTLRIDPLLLAGETDPTTRVTLGKQLTQDLLLLYSTNVGGEAGQLYGLEYQLNRRLRLYAERGITGGVGGDLRYLTHFRLGGKEEPAGREDEPRLPRPPVQRIVLEGAGELARAIQRRLPLKEGEPFGRRQMLEGATEIKRLFLEKGYLEAAVRSSAREGAEGMVVTYSIVPGRRIEVRFEGVGRDEKNIRAALQELWEEAFFTEDLLDEAERVIARYYRERGHYTVLVDRSTRSLDGGVVVTFRVDPGEVVAVEVIEISGNSEVPTERIRRQMLTAPDTIFTRRVLEPRVLEEDLSAIRRLYREEGFLSARVESRITLSPDARVARIELEIREGERARVASVSLEGVEEERRDELARQAGLTPGQPYSPRALEEGEIAIRRALDRAGYPDARVSGEAVHRSDAVDVVFRVEAGEKQHIRKIEIEGNRLTTEKTIRREMGLSPGDPLSTEGMREAQRKLYRLGIFESVTIESVPAPEGKEGRIVIIRVGESDNLTLAVGAGYDSETGPRGTLEIANSNFRGRGRYVSLQTRLSGRDERVQVLVKERRLFGRDWEALLATFWERQEREAFEFERTGGSLQIRRPITKALTGFFRSGLNVSKVDPSVPSEVLRELGERRERGTVRLGSAGYSLVRDTRDSPFTPKSGTFLSGDLRLFAGQRGRDPGAGRPDAETLTFSKVFLQGTYQRRIWKGAVVATSARLGVAPRFGSTEAVPLVERFFGGGDTSVRGFPRDLLGGSVERDGVIDANGDGTYDSRDFDDPRGTLVPVVKRDDRGRLRIENLQPLGGEAVLVFNQELRFPIKGSFGGVVFYDAGNVYRSVSDLDSGRLRHALGAGLRLDTAVGPVRLEYGRKLDRQPGESRGQFYFSIGTAF